MATHTIVATVLGLVFHCSHVEMNGEGKGVDEVMVARLWEGGKKVLGKNREKESLRQESFWYFRRLSQSKHNKQCLA